MPRLAVNYLFVTNKLEFILSAMMNNFNQLTVEALIIAKVVENVVPYTL